MGGEFLRFHNQFKWCLRCNGVIDATTAAVPANIQSLFPVWNDASTWNVAPLAPIARWVFHSLSDTEHQYQIVRNLFAGWVQDDWKVGNNLSLNLGVRYDLDTNAHSEKASFMPWLPGNLPHDTNNLAPRLGTSTASMTGRPCAAGMGSSSRSPPTTESNKQRGICTDSRIRSSITGAPTLRRSEMGFMGGSMGPSRASRNRCETPVT